MNSKVLRAFFLVRIGCHAYSRNAMTLPQFSKMIKRLGSPSILFWLLPYMMALLVVGTLAQAELGVFAAQERFFYAWFIWVAFIPLPGGMLCGVIFFLNLLVKFLTASDWGLKKSGVHIAHVGVLVLLIGGFVSHGTRSEQVIALNPAEVTSMAASFTETDFVILKDGLPFIKTDFQNLGVQDYSTLPFEFKLLSACENCETVPRPEEETAGWKRPANAMKLMEAGVRMQPEENLQGLSFEIQGAGVADGKYVTFLYFPKPPTFDVDDAEYTFLVERRQQALPFTLSLDKFDIETYPGSKQVKNYTSHLTLLDENNTMSQIVTMNKPLRYKGYTLYQTSFFANPDNSLSSVLTIVKNQGRIFPYASVFLIGLGLIIHTGFAFRNMQRQG